MAKRLPDLQVLIPYKDLLALVQASESLETLTADNKRLHDQVSALHNQFTDLLEKFGELRCFVND